MACYIILLNYSCQHSGIPQARTLHWRTRQAPGTTKWWPSALPPTSLSASSAPSRATKAPSMPTLVANYILNASSGALSTSSLATLKPSSRIASPSTTSPQTIRSRSSRPKVEGTESKSRASQSGDAREGNSYRLGRYLIRPNPSEIGKTRFI